MNSLRLVHLNSVYPQNSCRVPPPAVVISVFSWAAQGWNSGICNRILKDLWQLENTSTTICWMPTASFPLHFASLFLNWGIFLLQNSSPTAQSIPSGPAFWTKERIRVLIVSLTLKVFIFWTHFILLLGMAALWKNCGEPKGFAFKVCAQYEVSTYSYCDGLVLKWTIL